MDIALRYDNDRQLADLVIQDGDLLADEGLETAVLISLFTDREAEPGDVEPGEDRRGWWGDALNDNPQDRIGSRLWLLARETLSDATLRRAEDYSKEALQWMIEDGVAEAVNVTASIIQANDDQLMALAVEIVKPGTPPSRWQKTWEVHLNAV